MRITDIDTPSLIIDKNILESNIRRIQELANKHNIKLRPHIKTHKIPAIAKMQITAGAYGISTAKVSEAEVMFKHGLDDILIANIITVGSKIERMVKLVKQGCKLACCVDSTEGVELLNNTFSKYGIEFNTMIEIDTGLGRCGLTDYNMILGLCRKIESTKYIKLRGILTHAGHVYSAESDDKVREIGLSEGEFMVELANKLRSDGIGIDEISVGSTPTSQYCSTISGITELRIGNYVFHDMTQVSLGSATIEQCSLSVLTTVISKSTEDRIIIDAGSKSLSSELLGSQFSQSNGYGYIKNKNAVIYRLSEEHGFISCQAEDFMINGRLEIIPNHACTVTNLFDYACLVDGVDVIDRLEISARGKSQ